MACPAAPLLRWRLLLPPRLLSAIMITACVKPQAVIGCGVQCLGVPPGCHTRPVRYTKARGESDEWVFGSTRVGEWFLDVHDQMMTDDQEPRAGDGACPDEYETAGVVCACAFTRTELQDHDKTAGAGQDLLMQLEADAGFTFGAGGLCYTTDRDAATSGWTEDPDCPGGGIGYATACPRSELQREGSCGMGTLLTVLFALVVGVLLLVFGRLICRKRPAGPTAVEDHAAFGPRHTQPAIVAAVP